MADTKEKKIRIYKLATEYNLSADSLVEFLNSKGFKVKNHMSLLEDDMVTAINAHYKKEIEKAEHHYKKLAEFHKKRAERAIKDAKEDGKEIEVQEVSPTAETVEAESIIKATEKIIVQGIVKHNLLIAFQTVLLKYFTFLSNINFSPAILYYR